MNVIKTLSRIGLITVFIGLSLIMTLIKQSNRTKTVSNDSQGKLTELKSLDDKITVINQRKKIESYSIATSSAKKDQKTSITLEKIFKKDKDLYSVEKDSEEISLLVTGDVSLARSVNFQIQKRNNPNYIFEDMAEVLKNSDLTLINLESPLIENCPLTNEGMIFCSNATNAEGLMKAGITTASLANNHIKDHGQEGIVETNNTLNNYGIQPINQGEYAIWNIKGINLAIIAFDLVWHTVEEIELIKAVKNAKDQADIVVVFFHWGNEYTINPTKSQRNIAHLMIDSGADLVIGNHPHWVQTVEIYRDNLIVYSHGNFVFDQLWSEETKEGIIGKYFFNSQHLIEAEFLPIYINSLFQPTIADKTRAKKILGRIYQSSTQFMQEKGDKE